MANPWVFQEVKQYLATGTQPLPATAEQRFELMRRHCQMAITRSSRGEFEVMRAMRNRLMHYTRSLRGGKFLRARFGQIASVVELDDVLASYLAHRDELLEATETGETDGLSA
jgi:tRNA-dihydrouridine synthase